MWIRTLGITGCAMMIAAMRTLLAPPLSPDGPPRMGRLGAWEDVAVTLALSGMFGAAVWLAGAVGGRPRATALLVGPAAWAVALAAVPLHPMNFCANGGRDDLGSVYLPMALAAGPVALVVSLTPLARPSVLTHTMIVAALLLVASTPMFAEGYDGPWMVSQAWRSAGALTILGLLAQIVARTAAWARSDEMPPARTEPTEQGCPAIETSRCP